MAAAGTGGSDASKLELFAAIRHDARRGASIRALAERYRDHRRTVRLALTAPAPAARKPPVRRANRLAPFKPAIDSVRRPLGVAVMAYKAAFGLGEIVVGVLLAVPASTRRRPSPGCRPRSCEDPGDRFVALVSRHLPALLRHRGWSRPG